MSTSASPARATSASRLSSMGERSSNRPSLATRRPPIQWSGETSMPATVLTRRPRYQVWHSPPFHGRRCHVALRDRRLTARPSTCVARVAKRSLEEVPYLVPPLDLPYRLEVVDRVCEREAEALADPDGREGGVLLARRVVELERRRALVDRRDRAVAAPRPHQLVDGRVVVATRREPREVAAVDERRIVVRRPRFGLALGRDRPPREQTPMGRAHARERPPLGEAVQAERPRHLDLPELLGEALDPPAHQREVAVDPDVRARRDRLAAKRPGDDDEELLVLPPRRVDQLVAPLRARLPVDEERGAPAGILRERLDPLGQHRRDRRRLRPVLDYEEVADVVPGRSGYERRRPAGRQRQRVPPLLTHAGT